MKQEFFYSQPLLQQHSRSWPVATSKLKLMKQPL